MLNGMALNASFEGACVRLSTALPEGSVVGVAFAGAPRVWGVFAGWWPNRARRSFTAYAFRLRWNGEGLTHAPIVACGSGRAFVGGLWA